LLIFVLILVKINLSKKNSDLTGNEAVIKEINRLLLPLDAKTLTESDFDTLKELVKKDSYASEEVEELILLTKYKEYSHVGHGLGFLYSYIISGKEPICLGHLLSHYYVFMKHGEEKVAEDNFMEAKNKFIEWKEIEEAHNENYRAEINYTSFKELFSKAIDSIDSGNSVTSDDEIDSLAEASCAAL